MLYNALAGGASQSLRIDTQGKLLGTAILDLELPDYLSLVIYRCSLTCRSSKSTFTNTPAQSCSIGPTSGTRCCAS